MSHQLEEIIGYHFHNPLLLETALTHTSYANESRTPVKHNERLEFLGDSVLQIVSADYLFHAYADRPEGDLTRIRASLVSEGALFQFAQEIHLGEYLRLGRGEERCGGRTRPSVVSDAFEAVIAALFTSGSSIFSPSWVSQTRSSSALYQPFNLFSYPEFHIQLVARLQGQRYH